MGPRYRAPRNPTRSQISRAKTVQTWHYILRKQLTALNDINALRARGSVYCSSRVMDRVERPERLFGWALPEHFAAPPRFRGEDGVGLRSQRPEVRRRPGRNEHRQQD